MVPNHEDEECTLRESSKVILRFLKDLYTEAGVELEMLQTYEGANITTPGELLHKFNRIKRICIKFFEWQTFVSSQALLSELRDRWMETELFDRTPRHVRTACSRCVSDLSLFIGQLHEDLNAHQPPTLHEWPPMLDN